MSESDKSMDPNDRLDALEKKMLLLQRDLDWWRWIARRVVPTTALILLIAFGIGAHSVYQGIDNLIQHRTVDSAIKDIDIDRNKAVTAVQKCEQDMADAGDILNGLKTHHFLQDGDEVMLANVDLDHDLEDTDGENESVWLRAGNRSKTGTFKPSDTDARLAWTDTGLNTSPDDHEIWTIQKAPTPKNVP